LIDIR